MKAVSLRLVSDLQFLLVLSAVLPLSTAVVERASEIARTSTNVSDWDPLESLGAKLSHHPDASENEDAAEVRTQQSFTSKGDSGDKEGTLKISEEEVSLPLNHSRSPSIRLTDGEQAGSSDDTKDNTTEGTLKDVAESVPVSTQQHPEDKGTEPRRAVPTKNEEEEEEDRHNFALAKDGAKVVAANKEAKKASALLDNDADTFLKNECKADKWVILELSQVAKMDAFLLSQNELYSSRVKEFELRGRQAHPRAEGTDYAKTLNSSSWQLLGRFNATNCKGTQTFKLERPTWTKFLQLRVLSHFGTEAVCALNDICVFGKSAAEDLEARLSLEPQAGDASLEADPETPQEAVAALEASKQADNGSSSSNVSLNEPTATATPTKEEMPEVAILEVQGAGPSAAFPKEELLPGESAAANHSLPAAAAEVCNVSEAGPGFPQKPPQQPELSSTESPGLGKAKAENHSDAQTAGLLPEDLLPGAHEELPVNSAGSAATRHGGSMYDLIVQELKAMKLAQKATARTLAHFQKNVTAVMGGFAFELDLLSSRILQAEPLRPAIMPASQDSNVCSSTDFKSGEGLDFREGQCSGNAAGASMKVVKPLSELELLQLEVAALKEMVLQSKRQADSMLLALAFSLLGGIGFSLTLGNKIQLPAKGLLLLFASIPVGLFSCFWLRER